jgi:hypothetical protein
MLRLGVAAYYQLGRPVVLFADGLSAAEAKVAVRAISGIQRRQVLEWYGSSPWGA